jgi:hypothetical protein
MNGSNKEYNGLGTDKIISSFYVPIEFYDFFNKTVFTAITFTKPKPASNEIGRFKTAPKAFPNVAPT